MISGIVKKDNFDLFEFLIVENDKVVEIAKNFGFNKYLYDMNAYVGFESKFLID